MNLRKLQAVMEIVAKYVDADKSWVCAEHDIIFLPLDSDAEISAEDAARMDELGAHKSSEGDGCWAVFT